MMSSTPQTESLESWLRSNGTYIHPSIRVLQSAERGVHLHATALVEPGTTFITLPHRLAFSYLNAIVDDAFPVFRQHMHRLESEAIGHFYLMAQYMNRKQSFWQPYLESLPRPESILTQPLFFTDGEDIAWLEGTDVWHSAVRRVEVYEKYYQSGIAMLNQAGIDTEPYTW